MKCLKKYTWVKVPRGEIPFHAKGILIYYMRLASRAAFHKGTARYCGYDIMPRRLEPGSAAW